MASSIVTMLMLCSGYTVDLELAWIPRSALGVDILHQPFPGLFDVFGMDEQPASCHFGVWVVLGFVVVEEGSSLDLRAHFS